jgi:hypothetical protein
MFLIQQSLSISGLPISEKSPYRKLALYSRIAFAAIWSYFGN